MESGIRRYRNYLTISGTAVIVFSIWSFFRFILYLYTNPTVFSEWFEQNMPENIELRKGMIIVAVVYSVLFGITILINLYIGKGAIREGRGEKGGWLYLILSLLYVGSSLAAVYSEYISQNALAGGLKAGTGLIVDLSFCFAHVNLLYSAFRLRRLIRKKA